MKLAASWRKDFAQSGHQPTRRTVEAKWRSCVTHQTISEVVFRVSRKATDTWSTDWKDGIGHPSSGKCRGSELQSSCTILHRECAPTANQTKIAQIVEVTHAIWSTFFIAADFNMQLDQLLDTGCVRSSEQAARTAAPDVAHTTGCCLGCRLRFSHWAACQGPVNQVTPKKMGRRTVPPKRPPQSVRLSPPDRPPKNVHARSPHDGTFCIGTTRLCARRAKTITQPTPRSAQVSLVT